MKRWSLFLLIALVAITPTAYALQSFFDVVPTDESLTMLGHIFGTVGTLQLGQGQGGALLGTAFKVFNASVLTLGGIIMIYTLTISTINTAQEGEMLGKKWSSIWVPIRSVAGVALLIPTASGYSLIQVMTMWIIMQGIGAANQLWFTVVDYVNEHGAIGSTAFGYDAFINMDQYLQQTFTSLACVHAVNRNNLDQGRPNSEDAQFFLEDVPNTNDKVLYFGQALVTPQTEAAKAVCGKIVFNGAAAGVANNVRDAMNSNRDAKLAGTLAILTTLDDTAYAIGNANTATQAGAIVLDPASYPSTPPQGIKFSAGRSYSGIVSAHASNVARQFNTDPWVAAGYGAAVGGGAGMVGGPGGAAVGAGVGAGLGAGGAALANRWMNQSSNWPAQAKQLGWAYTGSFYFILANSSESTLSDDLLRLPTPPVPSTGFSEDVDKKIEVAGSYLELDHYRGSNALNIHYTSNFTTGGATERIMKETLGYFGKIIVQGLISMMAYSSNASANEILNSNPIQNVRQTASLTLYVIEIVWITSAIVVIALMLIASPVSCLNPGGFTMQTVIFWVMPMVVAMIGLLWAAMAMLAYYVPMIPYIVFTLGVIGWMMAVIEAMIAAPIVALGIVTPTNDELGKTSHAILLMVNVFLRPILMVIGFVMGVLLLKISIYLLNKGFMATFLASGGGFPIFGSVAVLSIYTALFLLFVHKAFSLIHLIPDKVLRWIGSGGESLGQEAQGLQEVKGKAQEGGKAGGEMTKGGVAALNKRAEGKFDKSKKGANLTS